MNWSTLFAWPESLKSFEGIFTSVNEPWRWLDLIGSALEGADYHNSSGHVTFPDGLHVSGPVFIHESVKLPPYGVIEGPAWIGPESQLRPGVYIRGNVIVGRGSVLGNSCEYKNSLLMDNVETAHFNYVGDSILGTRAHLGAGVILANLKLKRDEVRMHTPEGRIPSGRKKVGAILGEGAEVGCNAVLQPGTILGKGAIVMSTLAYGGYLPDGQVAQK